MIDCSICLNEEIEDLDKCMNNCGHIFCKSCLDTWLNRGNDDDSTILIAEIIQPTSDDVEG